MIRLQVLLSCLYICQASFFLMWNKSLELTSGLNAIAIDVIVHTSGTRALAWDSCTRVGVITQVP